MNESEVTRRGFIGMGACGAVMATSTLAQEGTSETRPPKGPSVWLDMDQAALDAAYDQSVWATNLQQVAARFASNSEIARERLGAPRTFAYGTAQNETVEVYSAERADAPVQLFIHGGGWRAGRARDYAFLAEPFVHAGAHFVAADFSSIDDFGGNLASLAAQVRRAVAWVSRNATQFGGNPRELYVSGHSSGAHLASVVLVTDWEGEFGLPQDTIKGALLCSGMYDMKPVRLSSRREYVKFTDEIEAAMSAQRQLERLHCPVIVAYGSHESPEFKRQARDFAAAVTAVGKPAELILAQGYNHMEIIETLANPYGVLGHAVLEQMKL